MRESFLRDVFDETEPEPKTTLDQGDMIQVKKPPDIRNSGSLFSVKIYGIVLCLIFATQSGLSLYWVCRTCHFDERTSCIGQLP